MTLPVAYEAPYLLARGFNTLDHLSGGRVAWNIVTSYLQSGARSLGDTALRAHDESYDRADEFLDVCFKLRKGSWEDEKSLYLGCGISLQALSE